MTATTFKVLPFDTEQGRVPGHELRIYQYEWMGARIERVAIDQWDPAAKISVEVLVHWTEVSKYLKRVWPKCGSIVAVILTDGRRIHAKSYSVSHYDNEAYMDAPIIARDTFRIDTLNSGDRLWEVVGVAEWAGSRRDAAATEKYLSCPWARDNAKLAQPA